MTHLLRSRIFWLIILATVLGGTVFGMTRARRELIDRFSQQPEIDAWEDWRTAAKKAEGPVARRVSKSAEPPTLVLLRDHFIACLTGMLFFESALVGFFMLIVRGMLSSPNHHVDLAEVKPR